VHVTDLAAAFVAAVNAVSNPPAVYNVGSGRAYSEQEVWSACHKVFGIKPQVRSWLAGNCRNLQELAGQQLMRHPALAICEAPILLCGSYLNVT
jgi:nucleoside-diphosphate-sugar epimerase